MLIGAAVAGAVVWRKGAITVLPPLPGGSYAFPSGINSSGLVSGASLHALLPPAMRPPALAEPQP